MNTIHSVSNTSLVRSSEAVAVRNSFSFRSLMMRVMLVVAIVCGIIGVMDAQTQTLTFSLTSNPGGWPTTASSTLTNYTYTLGSTNYTFALKNVKQNSGYLMLNYVAVLGLPKISGYKLTKVVAYNSGGCSTSTKVGISSSYTSESYISGGAKQTWSTQGSSYTYNLTTTADNTMYYMYVTNKNAQITQLVLTYTSVAPSYTITAQSNNNSLGTVSLSGTTITATPSECVGYASPAYTVISGTASVTQSGNRFIVTPSSDCTVKINFAEKPTYTVSWDVNGTNYSNTYCKDATIPSGDIPSPTSSNCDGSKVFVGWTTHSDYYSRSEAPDDLTQTPSTTVTANVTYYAVFAIRDITGYEERLSQTLQYDSWLYYGSTTDKDNYRLFHTGSYIQSAAFDLSTLSKVIVYGGTYGGSIYNSLTIGNGTNIWKDVTVSGSSQTGENVYTDGTTLSGTGSLKIISNSGTATGTVSGIRISQVKIYVMAPVYAYSNYTTDCSHSDTYSVVYYANGATGDVPVDDNEYESGDNVTVLEPENLNVEGFHFYRWNTAADGSGTNYRVGDEIEVGTDNIRLYAIWKATITWLANGLSVESYQYNYGDYISEDTPADGDAEDYACVGKHFIGWSESPFEDNGDRPSIITRDQIVGIAVPGDKIYYAVYAETNPSDAPMNTNLWSESWDGGTDKTPSTYDFGGTTVYGGASLTYSQTGTTNIRSDLNYAGGTIPELFLQSGNKTWTISGIPTGGAYQMSLTFKSNKESFNLAGTTVGIAISGSGKNWTIINSGNVANFDLILTNTGGDNARIDDVELKVVQISAGATAYTTFCPCNYGTITGIDNGDMVWAGKNVGADWNDKDNWVVYNNSSEPKYHLTAEAPATSNNVIVVQKAECGITVSPNISENVTCGNLTMFNGLNLTIAENKTLTINGDATFTSGIINGNVIFGSGAKVYDASTSSHVDGIVTKIGAANSTDFYFPTGNNGNLGKVEVTNDASDVSVQYFSNPAGFSANDLPRWWASASVSGFDHVSNVEYWKISSNEAITANFVAEASSDMHFNSGTDEEDRNTDNIQMAFYDNNRWTNVGGSASISDNTLTITDAEIPASATRGISGNYTTFGSKSKSTVLPIELVSFTANCDGKSSLIEWTTATEKNNDFFVLERSYDAVNFKEIARIAGAGNSIEPISYAYTDYGVRNGDNYYRLVQVDYDGTSTASEIIVANCPAETLDEPDVLAFPNPFDDNLTLHFENFGNIQATVEVYDMLGMMVQTQKVNCSQNDYEVVLRLAGLSDGTYNVRISTADFVINRKVVKE